MAEASTTVAAPMDEGKETEEMDNQELLELLRADLSAAEARTDRRFEEVKEEIKEVKAQVEEVRQELKTEIQDVRQELKIEIKEVKQELKADIKDAKQEVTAYVDKRIDDGVNATNQRIDDLRDYIEANRLIKNNWRTFAIAALATAAVVGTFVLQLMEALN